jgi:hypothetical protein
MLRSIIKTDLYHNTETVCRTLRFCWQRFIVIWILTIFKYPKFKARMIRRRWESLNNYQVKLEIKDMENLRKLLALHPEPMPGMNFSRN